jgi:hypothetical protein
MKAKKKTRAGKSSFNRALNDAQAKLERAQVQLAKMQLRVVELNQQIPHLQRIIAALGGESAPYRDFSNGTPRPIPEELKKYVRPTDLSGMGSIPNPQVVPPAALPTAPEPERLPSDDDPNALLRD